MQTQIPVKADTDVHQVYSPEWLYDMMMGVIEPDLMIENCKHLDEKYAGETEEERRIRMEHYAMAFVLYEECLEELGALYQESMGELKEEMQEYALGLQTQEDQQTMQHLEQAFDNDSDAHT